MTATGAGFELRDHTADIALYVWADSVEGLFRAAAEGFYATVGELRDAATCRSDTIRLEANDLVGLLHDFLSELLFRLETKGERLADFTFDRLGDTFWEVTVAVARVDEHASTFDREVKAVTYHDLNIIRRDGRYEVTIVLDI